MSSQVAEGGVVLIVVGYVAVVPSMFAYLGPGTAFFGFPITPAQARTSRAERV